MSLCFSLQLFIYCSCHLISCPPPPPQNNLPRSSSFLISQQHPLTFCPVSSTDAICVQNVPASALQVTSHGRLPRRPLSLDLVIISRTKACVSGFSGGRYERWCIRCRTINRFQINIAIYQMQFSNYEPALLFLSPNLQRVSWAASQSLSASDHHSIRTPNCRTYKTYFIHSLFLV